MSTGTRDSFAPPRRWFYAAVAFQLLLMAGLILSKQATLWTGRPVVLETVPVDPRDLFRGDYVVLSYKISALDPVQVSLPPRVERGQSVYVSLRRPDPPDRFWTASAVSLEKPTDGATTFLRGRALEAYPGGRAPDFRPADRLRLEYGIESYFVPEGKGRDLESVQADPNAVLAVEAVVDRSGSAVIRRVSRERR